MSENIIYIICGAIAAIVGWLIFLTAKYRQLLKKGEIIFADANPRKIASLITEYFETIQKVEARNQSIEKKLKEIGAIAGAGLHRIGFIRYNPYGDVGGNQSFSLALLNDKNDGFVISSIHSREGTRVYSKSIKAGESSYNLSNEERKVLESAVRKGE